MMVQTYASPPAFKQALEQRLKSSSSSGVDFARRRQLLVFDRFLSDIPWTTIEQLTSAAGAVLNPVLAGSAGIWNPESWRWE